MAGADPPWNTNIHWGIPSRWIPPSPDLFHTFFPAWDAALRELLGQECQPYYQQYQKQAEDHVYTVVECLLKQFPQFRQLEMNISSVILGLTPTLLQAVGVNTVQVSLLHIHRPLLAFVLSMGSPARISLYSQYHIRTIKEAFPDHHQQPQKQLPDPGLRSLTRLELAKSLMIDIITLVFALGAAANSWYLAYQLGFWSICMFAVGYTWVPMIWHALAAPIHFVGLASFHLTLSVKKEPRPAAVTPATQQHVRKRNLVTVIPKHIERLLGILQLRRHVHLAARDHSSRPWRTYLLQLVNWLLYVATAAYTVFGSMLLASLIFISVADAVTILSRYMASAVVCRLVLVSELSRMKEIVKEVSIS